MKFSTRTNGLVGQPMFQILQQARLMEKNGAKLYHFELGDPDLKTPAPVRESAIQAIIDGKTHYSPSSGEPALLDAAIEVTLRSRKFMPRRTQLLVTPGANVQIYLALACACNHGDKVLVPTPYFPSYPAQIAALGLEMVPLQPDCNHKVSAYSINCAASRVGPRAVILNTPSNPTGAVYTKEELAEIYEACKRHDMLIISDEVYARMIYEGEFASISEHDQCSERVVVVNGFSKSFAMTGWRVGVVTGPDELIGKMTVMQETICSCVCQFSQLAAARALLYDAEIEQFLKLQANEYARRRREMLCAISNCSSVACNHPPNGGLYCWCKIQNGINSTEYAKYAMNRGVVLSPGWMFGDDTHVRFSFASSSLDIKEGISKLE